MLEDAGVKLVRNDKKRLLVEDEMKELIKGCDVAICGAEPMTAEVMDQAPELRFIARCAVGLDSIDLNAARREKYWRFICSRCKCRYSCRVNSYPHTHAY